MEIKVIKDGTTEEMVYNGCRVIREVCNKTIKSEWQYSNPRKLTTR